MAAHSHYQPIASPIHLKRHYYPVVVVGSGYGGSVAACRFSRATRPDGSRLGVCVLERGREMVPGKKEFPTTVGEVHRHMQFDWGSGRSGPRAAYMNFRIFKDISVLVGCGLGGGSLINAGVGIVSGNLDEPADPFWTDDRWPAKLVADREGLRAGFAAARQMLRPQVDPQASELPKYQALEKVATGIGGGVKAEPVEVYVNFDEPVTLPHGVRQATCKRCGDCITGCNYGAKGTLAMNYLADAWRHGAEIFTGVEVRDIEFRPEVAEGHGRWVLHFDLMHDPESLPPEDRHSFVLADHIVLAAGTLGSTEILLRSQVASGRAPLAFSGELGGHFSGNGDFTGFAYNSQAMTEVRAIGWGSVPQVDKPVGACITGGIEGTFGDAPFVIEDGVMAGALNGWPFSMLLNLLANVIGKDSAAAEAVAHQDLFETPTAMPFRPAGNGGQPADLAKTLMLLGNTLDSAGGRMTLDADWRLDLSWPGAAAEKTIESLNAAFEAGSGPNGLDATYLPNPVWGLEQLLTVHPLGGCRMAGDASRGVVDDIGRVFDPTKEHGAVHPGLYVLDGAIVPRPLGRNPSLTITALCERAARGIAGANGWIVDDDCSDEHFKALPARRHGQRNPFDLSAPGLLFDDRIRGYFSASVRAGDRDQLASYLLAYERARNGPRNPLEDCAVSLDLKTYVDDLDKFIRERDHMATLEGTVTIPVLSPSPLRVRHGKFQLLTANRMRPNTLNMRYRMVLEEPATDGDEPRRWFFDSFKEIRKDYYWRFPEFWRDTTTLYFSVCKGDRRGGPLVGKGILRVTLGDFWHLIWSIRRDEDADIWDDIPLKWRFYKFFLGGVLDTYLWVLRPTKTHPAHERPRRRRDLIIRARTPEARDIVTGDGKTLRLTRMQGGDKGPVMLTHGLGTSSRMFTLDTLAPNLAEYLYRENYDVWTLDYRASTLLPTSLEDFTADDVARFDYPAAVSEILRETGKHDLQVVVHCFGSMTFHMAMLSGSLGRVRSAVCSQVGAHPLVPLMGWLKAWARTPLLLQLGGIRRLDASADFRRPWWVAALDKGLQLWESPPGWNFNEWCRDASCQRCTFLFGRLYSHKQLNTPTHDAATELFGDVLMKTLGHSAKMVRKGRLVTFKGQDVYLDHLERLAIPIRYIHGAENQVFKPKSTHRTIEALSRRNGHGLYDRVLVPNYGHLDCIIGRNAARDVYPHILAHLEKTCQ